MSSLKESSTGERASATDIFEKLGLKKQDTVLLHSVQAVRWGRLTYKVLGLPNEKFWNYLIILSTMINFYCGTICFFFARKHLMSFILIYVACDLLYLFNLILLLLHRYWKRLEQLSTEQISTFAYTVDIISLLPQELLAIAIFGKKSQVTISLRWLTYIRLRHAIVFIKGLGEVVENRWRTFLISFMILIAVVQHLSTCLIYQSSCHHLRCLEHVDQIVAQRSNNTKLVDIQFPFSPDALTETVWYSGRWSEKIVESFPYYKEKAETWEWYFLSAYSFFDFFLTYGSGIILPVDSEDRLGFAFIMVLGYLFFDVWFLSFSYTISTQILSYRGDYDFKIESIQLFLSDVNVSNVVLNNIQDYFKILWLKKDGIKSADHFDTLPSPLQMEIMYDINITHLHRSLLFFDLQDFYLRTLSLIMVHEFLLPGDVLYYQGVVKRQLVVITSGILEVLSDEDNESPIIAFQAGTVLGEACLFFSLPAKATVRAAVYSEVKLIDRMDFIRNIKNYPIALQCLRERIMDRIEFTKKNIVKTVQKRKVLDLDADDEDTLIPIKALKERLMERKRKGKVTTEDIKDVTAQPSQSALAKTNDTYTKLYHLSIEDSNIETPVICLTFKFPWILDSESSFVKVWEQIVFYVHLAFLLVFAYEVVFLRDLDVLVHNLRFASDVVCLVDTLLSTVRSIVLKDKILRTFKEIIRYRLKTLDFYLNALPVLPFEFFMLALDDLEDIYYYRIYDLLMGVKILRIRRCYLLLSKFQRQFFSNHTVYAVLICFFYLTIMSYFGGCILFLNSCLFEACTEDSWFYQMMFQSVQRREEQPCYLLPEATSVYLATSIWLHVGVGDIRTIPPRDLYIFLIYLILGVFFVTYLKASLASIMSIRNTNSESFRQAVLSFKRFLEHYKVPIELIERVETYFVLRWNYDRGQGRHQFSMMAPEHLQMVVYKTELMGLFNKIPLFQLVDVDFLMNVILSARVRNYTPGAIICHVGDVDREMYIIQKGICSMIDVRGNFLKHLNAGGYYGEAETLFNLSKSIQLRATTTVKLVLITFRAFNSALSMFPGEMEVINTVMHNESILQDIEEIKERRLIATKEKVERKKKRKSNSFLSHLRQTFIISCRCYKTTNGREKYWDTFRKMGKWQILGLLLMPITINPEAWLLKIWIFMRLSLLLLTGMTFPFLLGLPPSGTIFAPIVLVTEATAYIELYVFLHVGYYNKQGLLISHPKLTAINYFKNSFTMDLIAAFPYYAVMPWFLQSNDYLDPLVSHVVNLDIHSIWRAMSLLQFHRCIGFIRFVNENVLAKKNIASFCIILPLSLLTLLLLTTFVIIDCYYEFFDYEVERYADLSKITLFDKAENIKYYGYFTCAKVSWVKNTGLNVSGPFSIIVLSYYWFLNLFSNMGMGDISPSEQSEMIINILLVFFGVLVFSYVLEFLNAETGGASILSLEYQQKLSELLAFLRKEHVAEIKIVKIFRYFEYVWNRTTGMENKGMLTELNSGLRGTIALFLYEKTLREVLIFKKLARPYLRVLAKNLTEEYFLKGDTIIKCYDVHNSVYIIIRGSVDILTPYNDFVTCIGNGGIFGNIHQAAPGCSSVTFKAGRNVDVLKMSSVVFYRIAQEYPVVKEVLDRVLEKVGDFIGPTFGHGIEVQDIEQDFTGINITTSSEDELYTKVSNTDVGSDVEKQEPTKVSTSEFGTGTKVIPKNPFLACLLFFRPSFWFKFALQPDHIIVNYVWAITLVVTLYQMFMIPFMFVTQHFNAVIIYLSWCIEPFFYLRIFFFLHVAYLDEYGSYVTNFRLIARHYFRDYRRVCWDFIPNIPLYLLYTIFSSHHASFVYYCFRLYHLLRGKYILQAFAMWSAPLMARRAPILIMKMIIIFALTVHYIVLINYFLFSDFGDFSNSSREYLRSASVWEAYVYCLFGISNLISRTGVKDIIPESQIETIFYIIVIISAEVIGCVLIVGVLMGIRILSQYITNYESKVMNMKKFLQNQGLSDHLMEKLWIYMKQIWSRDSGSHMPDLLVNAPYVMGCEIMTDIYSDHLRNGYLFKDINEALLRQICGHLKRVVFFKGNYIVQDGDTDASMYWIHRGEVSVLTVHSNLTETRHETLYVHDLFGLAQGLNYGLPHKYSYRAETYCDILVLKLEVWEHVMQHFPSDKEIIFRRMLNAYTIL